MESGETAKVASGVMRASISVVLMRTHPRLAIPIEPASEFGHCLTVNRTSPARSDTRPYRVFQLDRLLEVVRVKPSALCTLADRSGRSQNPSSGTRLLFAIDPRLAASLSNWADAHPLGKASRIGGWLTGGSSGRSFRRSPCGSSFVR